MDELNIKYLSLHGCRVAGSIQAASFITACAKQDTGRYVWVWNESSWVLPTKPHLQRVVWLTIMDFDFYATLWTLII